ncbi:hypothetical protein EB796_021189 [Bugula neritina]|uniref:Uncharacterized protein n=1 Tax=Bugula neritina TaxID=10212 RepID=A0A7J7J2V9_BUGNE|nr:hypothetical protein EB796_021189 [Bugula neritina]
MPASKYSKLKNCMENAAEFREVLSSLSESSKYKVLKQKRKKGETLLMRIARDGYADTMQCIAESLSPGDFCKLLNKRDKYSFTPIHRAVGREQIATLKCVVDAVSPDDLYQLFSVCDKYGETALHAAATSDHAEIVECIVNSMPPDKLCQLLMVRAYKRHRFSCPGDTALHRATEKGHIEFVKCMLSSVPVTDLDKLLKIVGEDGNTFVHMAAVEGLPEIIKHIAHLIPSTDFVGLFISQNRSRKPVLHCAAEIQCAGQIETLKCIIDSVPPDDLSKLLSVKDRDGDTALHKAALGDRVEALTCLVDAAVRVGHLSRVAIIANKRGNTVVHQTAKLKGHTEKLRYLLNNLSTPDCLEILSLENFEDPYYTPLALAKSEKNFEAAFCIEEFLNKNEHTPQGKNVKLN